jgi:uncharacterized repeat protein (TIGR01451 family)
MKLITNLKKWSPRVKNAAAAMLFLTAYTISAVGPFASIASAAIVSSTVSSTGFVISGAYSSVAGQPTGTGQFKNGNVGAYPEGACIPAVFQVKNTSGTTGDLFVTPVYDYSQVGTSQRGFTDLEVVTSALNDVTTATNLNQMSYTGSSLSAATSFKTTSGAPVSASVSGAYAGNNTSTAAVSSADTFRHYNVTLLNVPANETVNVLLCGRLGLDASEYNGSSLSIRTVQGGQENVPIPVNQILALPSITLTKTVAQGTALPSDFSFTVSPAINGVSTYPIAVGTNSVTISNVSPDGVYTITESGPAGYVFSGGTGTACTPTQSTVGTASGQMVATVSAGKPANNAICNFTNNVLKGSITITKDAVPNGPQDFAFTTTGTGLGAFSLDDDSDATLSNTKTFTQLVPGTYSVTETATNGWDLSGLTCTGGGTQVDGATVSITLAPGANVSCTYTNRQHGQIIVNKVTNPANDQTAFSVTASGTAAIVGNTTRSLTTSSPVTYEVSQGTYSVSETVPTGWTQTANTCSNLVINGNTPLVNGIPTVTCTITNTKLAKLRIVKDALPNDPQDFAFTTTGTGLSAFSLDDDSDATLENSHEFVDLAPGTYTVTETSTDGWSLTGLSCDTNNFIANGAQVSVQLAAGQVTTCTYTNTKFGSISGTKYEVNADGSTVAVEPSGWIITLFNGDVSTGLTQTTDANGYYTFTGLLPGAYSVSESSLNGWTQVYNPLSPINLLAGQEAENNNFGNFKNGSISGYKFNDLNGKDGRDEGEPGISGWGVTLTGTTKAVNGQPSVAIGPIVNTTNTAGYYEFTNLAPGTYTVCEEQRVNWVQTYPGLNVCQTIVIDISGESNANSNFGNRAQGTIEVKKVLSPATDPGKFNLAVDVETQASNVGDGGTTGQVTVWAGDHTASEAAGTATDLANYSSTYSCSNGQEGTGISISDITVSAGDHIVCTFTNTRNTGTITVIKQVVNDNGGTAAVSDFNLYVNGDTVTSNVANTYNTAVSYAVSEDTKAGYTQTSLICTLAGLPIAVPFTLQTGQNIICTITNDDIGPKLIVKKVVDNGITNLTKESSDFTMNVDATNVSDSSFAGSSSGTTVTLDAGSYSVTEGSHSGYTMTASVDCTGTVEIGEVKTCTITNTAIEDPGISVVKTGPAFAHEGDTVTYTFTVKNTGNVAFPSGSVIDDVAGDDAVLQTDDDNGVLDQGETWVFTIDYVIPANTTSIHNTVTACGQYGSDELMQEICDEDDHTLTVLHPGIKVVKSGPANAQIGTIGTYTFTVTNTGDTPLTMDSVVDNLAGNGIYVSGDVNDNDRLDLNESWVFQAKLLYGQNGNIVNTVKVCAVDVLKGEVCSSDSHTTIVYTPQVLAEVTPPKLENTGNSIWTAIILSASITTLAVATTLQRRRYDSANK